MSKENKRRSESGLSIDRRTVLSGITGVTLGTTLFAGNGGAEPTNGQKETKATENPEPSRYTPRPDGDGVGGTKSLNGTWEFALAGSDTPPAGSSGVVTPDSSSKGNDATVVGDPPVVRDSSMQAIDLAGDSYVAVGDPTDLDFTEPGFSIQLDFKYSGDTILFSKGNSQYSAGVYGGSLSFWTAGEGAWPTVGGGDLNSNQWYSATFAVDANEIRLYVDGERVGKTSHNFSSISSTDSPLTVGYNSGDGTQGNPVVDSFHVFDTALTDSQVASGFDSVPESAVAWLPFDTASDGTTPDESGANNPGRLLNDPAFVSGQGGRGLDLSGDAYVSAGSADSLDFSSTGFTLQATVRYDGGSGLILDTGSSGVSNGTEQFGLGIYDGTVSFFMQAADGNYPNSLQTDISTGEWHRITVSVTDTENILYVDGERIGSVSHGATGLADSTAPFVVGGDDLDIAVKSTAAFDTALNATRVQDGFQRVPKTAVVWLTYDTLQDRSVEWRDETVPGQWAYDHYYVPEDSSNWYPPNGDLGWYRREFDVPGGWNDGRLKLRFDAVYSHAWVYLNGTQVAEHVGGYTAFEADITEAVNQSGSNTLAVGVAQHSKSDDMAWQNVTGGITRGVTLFSVPDTHLSDCVVRTSIHDESSATTNITTRVTNAGRTDTDGANVTVTLQNPDGSTAGSAHADVGRVSAGDSKRSSLDIDVSDPLLWTPEQPRLYTAVVELTVNGTTERITERVGIREVRVDGNDLLINGESVLLRGIDWEEIYLPEDGQAVPPELTREDVKRLTEANINYIRTAHFPVSEAFIEACDEFGVIVEEEAPHMFVGRDRGDPYPEIVVQQTLEMVERDRNRPSVCIWSVANESNWYDCFGTAAKHARERDSTRPMIFDHDEYNPSDPWHDQFELRADHYPAIRTGTTVEQYADLSDPLLFNEYGHVYCYNDRELVTDPGLRDQWGTLLNEIWTQFREADSVAGAALWAGGDHLERWGAYLWGVLDRNRRHRPEFWHVKKVYAPVQFVDTEWHANGNRVTLTIQNRYEFMDLSECTFTWDNGNRTGDLSVDLAPGETTTVTLPVPGERIEVSAVHPDGHLINEFAASPDAHGKSRSSTPSKKAVRTTSGSIEAETDSFSLQIDSKSGAIAISSPAGTQLIDGLDLAITPTQHSAGREYATAVPMEYHPAGRAVTDVTQKGNSGIAVTVEYDSANGVFTLHPYEDRLEIEYEFTLTTPVDAREAGVALTGKPDLTTLSWNRDGLWSTYPVNHIGRQSGTALAFPSGSRPENEGIEIQAGQPWKDDATTHGSNDFRSTKRNVRSAALRNGSGDGIRVVSEGEQHVRSQARSNGVDLLVLDRSISGTNANGWMNRKPVLNQDPTLDAGETLRGSTTVQVVSDAAAIAHVKPTTTDATVGERVEFRIEDATGKDRWITSLDWNLGDGATASGWYVAHRYDSAGRYTAEVTATDNIGNTTTNEVLITVSELKKAIAHVQPSTTTATVGERITFQVEDRSGADRWIDSLSWNFGDGTTSTGWWAAHRYDSTATYTIQLTATDNTGHTTTDDVAVTVESN